MISYLDAKAMYFRRRIAAWGKKNQRDFPWRRTKNTFLILIAEMMLSRTKANQVVPVYLSFIELYPSPESLTRATKDDIAKMLKPLGLPWRVDNFQKMARILVDKFEGRVPSSYDQLRELPGVGDYTASAVCCFGFGKVVPIVDTNTVRVVGRYFGFETHADSRKTKQVREAISTVTSRSFPNSYNMSLLDFAAIICKAREPECSICPVRKCCVFGQTQLSVK